MIEYSQTPLLRKDSLRAGHSSLGSNALAAHEARTTYPVSGDTPTQLWIDFESPATSIGNPFEDEDLGDLKDQEVRNELIGRLATHLNGRYPRMPIEDIEAVLIEIEDQKTTWSFAEIRTVIAAKAREMPREISSSKGKSKFDLPEDEKQQRDFAFSTKTRLTARIGKETYDFENGAHGHAEDGLIEKIDSLMEAGELDPSAEELILTINNSPCLERCAPNLANAQSKRWKFKRIVIRYANPHGSTEKNPQVFAEAAAILMKAGISMEPFEPRSVMTKAQRAALTQDQTKRFDDFANRRDTYRLPDPANKGNTPGGFSPPEKGSKGTRSRSRSRSRSRTRREKPRDPSASPARQRTKNQDHSKGKASSSSILQDPEAYRNLIEDDDVGTIDGKRVRVVHADDNGSCFYESLAYHLGDDFNARDLRRQAQQILEAQGDSEAAFRARSRGGYAQRAEMAALAGQLGATFIIFQYMNSWDEKPVRRRIGNGDTTYYFIQTLAHIRPLDIL